MKKKLLTTAILCLANFFARSQTNNATVSIYEFTYKTNFNFSIDQGQQYRQFESKLFAGDGGGSLFFSSPKKGSSNIANQDDLNIIILPDTLFKVIKLQQQGIVFFTDGSFSRKPKIYTDTLHPAQWDLIDERKMIDSLECYKAKTYFKGRNYIAWYCPSISIPNGPWKLGGLPGLIVEAHDTEKQLHFILSGIKRSKNYPDDLQKKYQQEAFPPYTNYIADGKNFIKKLNEQMNAQSSDCVECQTASKIKLHALESVFY
jgi:GLPGLI family protein